MVYRVQPAISAWGMKTYAALAPLPSHFRAAKCDEVDCPHYRDGWQSVIDEATELGQAQAHYIRRSSGRSFVEARDGALTVFLFEPGQPCFAAHQVPLERPPIFLVRDGDWRGNPHGTQPRIHARPEDWVEDFAEHQQAIADHRERG